MKKVLIIIPALLLLLGGGGAAAVYLDLLPPAIAAMLPFGDGEAGPETSEPEPLPVVEMDAFIVPVIRNGAIKSYITLAVTIECVDPAARVSVHHFLPFLRDAFLRDLHAVLPMRADQEDFVQSDFVRQRLRGLAESLVGPGLINAVVVENLYQRMFKPEKPVPKDAKTG